jgi:hypothetical protein
MSITQFLRTRADKNGVYSLVEYLNTNHHMGIEVKHLGLSWVVYTANNDRGQYFTSGRNVFRFLLNLGIDKERK